jgi:hypothetical protein
VTSAVGEQEYIWNYGGETFENDLLGEQERSGRKWMLDNWIMEMESPCN